MDQQQTDERVEALGPAERIISTLTTFSDHVVHNRPGMVTPTENTKTGVRWQPVIWKDEDGEKVVYSLHKTGKKTSQSRVGVMNGTLEIKDSAGIVAGEYRKPGIFPEVAEYFYRQVADVWQLDNEFAAHWASHAFAREHRDLKVILAAFMLVQNRMGEPVIEDGEILFHDDDFRGVGEAMCLIRAKLDINPKLLLRVGDILNLSGIAAINRELGFGVSARNPARGRYYKVVEKWLRYREKNLPMLEGLVKAGYRTTVMKLAQRVGYKPSSPKFFELLRWKQKQSNDGRRSINIGVELEAAESWKDLNEKEICELIVKDKPNWKRIVGLLPAGLTRAIVAAAVEAGSMSDQDLIIMTPTLEELGLLKVPAVEKKWKAALDKAENQRAANIAKNVKSKEAKEGLQDAVDKATVKALEEVTRGLRVYCIIDKSASMQGALERAQGYLIRFLGGFPLDRLHVSVFNTMGMELEIKASKAAAVQQAFRGHSAGGGTSYVQGVRVLAQKYKPEPDEDLLVLFVGDEEDTKTRALQLEFERYGLSPVAFGLLRIVGNAAYCHGRGSIVRDAATAMGIPCFPIDEQMFTSDDPYAVTRLLRDLIGATPVGETPAGVVRARKRKTLVEEILETPLLQKPVWA